jgi:hypothetical protein
VNTSVDDIRRLISIAHPDRHWLVLDEFPLEGGRRTIGTPRIDVLAIKTGQGGRHKPLTRIAFEIKVSRADFLSEQRNPEKRRKAYAICDEYWFAVPEKLVEKHEVPPECGLIWAVPWLAGPCVIKSARRLNSDRPSPFFMTDLARRAYQVGRRDGAATCAFERFDMLMEVAHMLVQNNATAKQRKSTVLKLSRAIMGMQRHAEGTALARIASGEEPTSTFFVHRALQSGRCKTVTRIRSHSDL